MTVDFRGFKCGVLVWQERHELEDASQFADAIGMEHALQMARGEIDMVEVEFSDGDVLRFGTNPVRMKQPIRVI